MFFVENRVQNIIYNDICCVNFKISRLSFTIMSPMNCIDFFIPKIIPDSQPRIISFADNWLCQFFSPPLLGMIHFPFQNTVA